MRSELPEGMYEWKEGRTNKMTTRDLNIPTSLCLEEGHQVHLLCADLYENNDEVGSNECESCSI